MALLSSWPSSSRPPAWWDQAGSRWCAWARYRSCTARPPLQSFSGRKSAHARSSREIPPYRLPTIASSRRKLPWSAISWLNFFSLLLFCFLTVRREKLTHIAKIINCYRGCQIKWNVFKSGHKMATFRDTHTFSPLVKIDDFTQNVALIFGSWSLSKKNTRHFL